MALFWEPNKSKVMVRTVKTRAIRMIYLVEICDTDLTDKIKVMNEHSNHFTSPIASSEDYVVQGDPALSFFSTSSFDKLS